ncbi:MAG: MMPL family transporter [Pseudonocardia sp.]|uniref:MMPL family transporter n=1 Tax=unclassified Pseudonocardia TaxID=2619320 RepID=UPI00086E652E|nr:MULTISPECIES: MMPL family transporter [unclassified Pseudonocardia]MBN9107346.1 MMPL family transporter [Pseudonocardia sp.]ODU25788.1 MAG: RND transporter [Pseudonocardia sp. SCN 72-51]ODV06588.1 MAG: RND transporter [Pseudonocardia sp. SCN 73-27]
MAELLYRLGHFAARRPWRVVTAWATLLVAAVVAVLVTGVNLTGATSIPGTPTEQVSERLQAELPGAGGGTGLVVLHTADGRPFTAGQQAAVSAALQRVGGISGVTQVVDPFAVAATRAAQEQQLAGGKAQLDAARARLAQGQAQLDAARAAGVPAGALAAQQQQLDQARAQLDAGTAQLTAGESLAALAAGIRTVSQDGSAAVATVAFGASQTAIPTETKDAVTATIRDAAVPGVEVDFSSEITQNLDGIAGPSEVVGVVIAAVVLLVMLGTLVAAGLPILTALVGVGVGVAGATAFSGLVEMTSVTPILGLMLGLAVGIDYALFVVNRHRRQLRAGVPLRESIALATGTSGNAVVFAGFTVVIALVALTITGIPFLGLMGIVGAACVAVAVLVAVTLTPALLSLIGLRLLSRKARSKPPAAQTPQRAPMSTGKAVLRAVGGIALLVVIAVPALSMRLGLPDGSSEPQDSTQYQAYATVAEKFGAGANGPLVVVADLPPGLDEQGRTAAQAAVAQEIGATEHVAAVAPVAVAPNGSFALFQVVPTDGPTSKTTEQLVDDLRAMTTPFAPNTPLGVAGSASGNIDISAKLAAALPIYLAVVVGLSLLIMIVVFRSILVPVTATVGFVLSYFAAMGAVVAIYQWGWLGPVFGVHDPGPVLNFLPTLLVGILFGLAMDYQLFLVSGMREAFVHGSPARRAVAEGLHAGRPVVTAAAIIMFSVFGGFVFSHLAMIRPMGFGLAFGVLFDAFVVRMLVIPALMHLAGNAAWWLPKWLDRILPNVDVEGASLERDHPTPAAQRPDALTPAG